MDSKYFQNIPNSVLEYTKGLSKEQKYTFFPAHKGLTENGKNLALGFSCFGLKIYFMTGEWQKLPVSDKENWTEYINSFQMSKKNFPDNSFIDKALTDSYKNLGLKQETKYIIKGALNLLPNFNLDNKNVAVKKAVNAETKQAVSSLYQVNAINLKKIENKFKTKSNLFDYLDSLDWTKPWASGAQFSSLCVLSKTQGFNIENYLAEFISRLSDKQTGSYFTSYPASSREIINGAMKVISGLDWLGQEIHRPQELIDFCLDNKPVLEGCDIVDFTYVLYKCTQQSTHRRSEVNKLFITFLDEINKLYKKEEGGFSYFYRKSQTHYYGSTITTGEDISDIHGTTLCLWAILMILDTLEIKDDNTYIIKP
tara:strand:- start:760 stop:1863 length:1104 start_codon:yes stop_codon:yes gene_type:complete